MHLKKKEFIELCALAMLLSLRKIAELRGVVLSATEEQKFKYAYTQFFDALGMAYTIVVAAQVTSKDLAILDSLLEKCDLIEFLESDFKVPKNRCAAALHAVCREREIVFVIGKLPREAALR